MLLNLRVDKVRATKEEDVVIVTTIAEFKFDRQHCDMERIQRFYALLDTWWERWGKPKYPIMDLLWEEAGKPSDEVSEKTSRR